MYGIYGRGIISIIFDMNVVASISTPHILWAKNSSSSCMVGYHEYVSTQTREDVLPLQPTRSLKGYFLKFYPDCIAFELEINSMCEARYINNADMKQYNTTIEPCAMLLIPSTTSYFLTRTPIVSELLSLEYDTLSDISPLAETCIISFSFGNTTSTSSKSKLTWKQSRKPQSIWSFMGTARKAHEAKQIIKIDRYMEQDYNLKLNVSTSEFDDKIAKITYDDEYVRLHRSQEFFFKEVRSYNASPISWNDAMEECRKHGLTLPQLRYWEEYRYFVFFFWHSILISNDPPFPLLVYIDVLHNGSKVCSCKYQ